MYDPFNVILKRELMISNFQNNFQTHQVRPSAEAELERHRSKEGYIDIHFRPHVEDGGFTKRVCHVQSNVRAVPQAETGFDTGNAQGCPLAQRISNQAC